ncbi:MAG: T9SS type A sorting domain-containing protein [Flavobacteriaceae bacterium]|nr:MAG: T9SS type A sorting domain-containing protein [Flavobacteriaceae bacterium]
MSSGADVLMTEDGTSVIDARTISQSTPPADASQDWTLVSNTVSGSSRTIIATRANNTGDSDDFVFSPTAGSIGMIWAHDNVNSFNYHNNRRGATTVGVTLGVESNKLLSFDMFPNPATDEVTIQLPTGTDKADVSIYDYVGRLIRSRAATSSNAKVDVTYLSSGMYIVRVVANDKIGIQRFIKN